MVLLFVQCVAPNYHCSNGICGCSKGYGNVHDITSSLYLCMPCREGKTLLEGKECPVGKYGEMLARMQIKQHHKHAHYVLKAGMISWKEELMKILPSRIAPVGSFSQADGSKKCFACPAGS